ncbi:putative O-methyltransferase YrrM [Breznakia sp. PF5-3]|uniref:O-methyltransferase n=1 Tax=unclassified Breznakia TaxID=2623764 RepID=UPI0024075EF5|nr:MULTISPECIES: O-methyltransferase [unclassified Breznakia]MDF9825141.1 putative O-methyltransferase YrrM [Breznakia sp. PM6-1]MDF9836000.1 putative O-methyltransferase YrrM [Breznakia sp. PF5-3]MDF9838098.1 putative O-methyltransferase YrrM [Breznakia sp. PFB2-8]MDF9860072.1 putative O-methyltransferase YrrM [Breznakia sp. PH5-24]
MENTIKQMEQYAKKNNIPIMEHEGIEFLATYIKNHEVKTILELGSAIGYSAIQMARINKDIHVVTVERDEKRYQEALKNLKTTKLEEQVDIYLADALTFSTDQKYDLIFIDAAKAQYIKFFERYKKNLKDDGVIISDNLKFHGMVDTQERIKNRNTRQLVNKIKKYIYFLEDNDEFSTSFYDIGDGIAISKRK